MPVRNAQVFLTETINSILNQSFQDWELIAIDDFSTDESFKLLKDFESTDQRIGVYKNREKGIIPALGLAFEHSKGMFITRMDADDIMPGNKLNSFWEHANSTKKQVITGKVTYFSNDKVSEGYKRYEKWLNNLVDKKEHWPFVYRECVIASPNWMVSRACFEKDVLINELVYPEDYDMVLKWYERGYEVLAIPEVTHHWREHPQRTSRQVEDYQQKAFFQLKTNRFIDLELERDDTVQLIGAGDKGKMVAKILSTRNIAFEWFDFKSDQHNQLIFGKKIHHLNTLNPKFKSILTAWPTSPKLQNEIISYLKEKGIVMGEKCWLF